jgi:leukotriene-A4 hydrolase
MQRGIVIGSLFLIVFTSAGCSRTPPPSMPSTPSDPSSYANVAAFTTEHLTLDLSVDFTTRILSGTAGLRLKRHDQAATELVLDTRDLTITRAEAAIGDGAWVDTRFSLDTATPAFGSALRIVMPPAADRVRVSYKTSPAARGLQWLEPEQTAGRKQPFLFSQAQAIQARSFIPLQDLPGVRQTYDATIRVQPGLVAVMAAELAGWPSPGVFRFSMPQAIPSYLIAIAVGDLAFRELGTRTGVWAEPSMLDAAAAEFADMEKMVATTEQMYGEYRWGRFDVLVLPPSFPFGGMENPRLTFATPTIIAGDKSLVSLIAHELAHSWSGNLVTNATWADFWLNEGFTTYLERRIVEAVYGKARADMEAMIGVRELEEGRKTLEVARDRTLLPDLAGRDPDDAYSTVPYEQGALFLTFLEHRFGREAFDRFLREWFETHAFKSATTKEFLSFLKSRLLDKKPGAVTDDEIQGWLNSETIPASAVLPESDAFARVAAVRDGWLRGGSIDAVASAAKAWTTQEWIHFIDSLPRRMDATRLAALDRQFALSGAKNAEIAHVWYRLAIANRYEPAYPPMERYLLNIGRRKLIVPLYRDLAATPDGKVRAQKIYAAARTGYHPLTQSAIDPLLQSGK